MIDECAKMSDMGKDDIVIELVAARYQLAALVDHVRCDSDFEIIGTFDPEYLRIPSKEWLDKIVLYGWEHRDKEDLGYGYGDYMDYGVIHDDDTDHAFEELIKKGIAVLPDYYDDSPNHEKYLEFREKEEPWPEDPRIQGDWDELAKLPKDELIRMLEHVKRRWVDLKASLKVLADDYEAESRLEIDMRSER
jgi:hypothetical protein